MQANELYASGKVIIRVLKVLDDRAYIICCTCPLMPVWTKLEALEGYELISEDACKDIVKIKDVDIATVEANRIRQMYHRFTVIADILPFIADETERAVRIDCNSKKYKVSKQTIRKYLCKYLAFQDIKALIPVERDYFRELTDDEKNMRWSLNKYFYNHKKNTLPTAYKMMLKEKYCDADGQMFKKYPSFYQYRYFYRKTKKLQNFYISRNGLTNYQRNNRPLLGDGIREYATAPGVGMIDGTVCDIYLVNESGQLVGRPIFIACIDAYSGLCCGYSLLWEGGVYSLREMLINVVVDKVKHCKKFGIVIQKEQWPCSDMMGVLVSDQGTEYAGQTFEQITELGITLINLPSYRPELKGPVEKLFDLIQKEYKPYLQGHGVIEPDFQERGAHDYRKDAHLTLLEFEKIVLKCIVYYNSASIVENFPYTDAMIKDEVKPYANCIWNWALHNEGTNLISISENQIVMTLLPRTTGTFNKFGLNVNRLRYRRDGYTEYYLKGGTVSVAYEPDSVSNVWLIENGKYIKFELIESRFRDKTLEEVNKLQKQKRDIIKIAQSAELQAEIDLANSIQVIVDGSKRRDGISIKNIKENRSKEQEKNHINRIVGGRKDD